MLKATATLIAAALAGMKAELDGGFCYIYAGPVPTEPGDALNMVDDHTELAKLSVDGDGVTGLTFAVPTGAVLSKNGDEWSGLIAFDGAEDAETSLAPTFFRFCPSGDNGRGAVTTERLQGTAGGPTSDAVMKLGSDLLTDNGSNTTGAAIFNVRIGSVG